MADGKAKPNAKKNAFNAMAIVSFITGNEKAASSTEPSSIGCFFVVASIQEMEKDNDSGDQN